VRTAVLSDVHGNLTALEAVVADLRGRSPDLVLHGGDLALMGHRPEAVIDRIRALGWRGVLGNTDELLWNPSELARQEKKAPKLRRHLRLMFGEYSPATRELLGEERLAWLRGLPTELRHEQLALVHAAPDDLWRAPMPSAEDRELADTYAPLGTELNIYGHIHRPFVRDVGALVVANAGSVGMPWDGDPRASYLLVDDGRASLVRVDYDHRAEAEALRRSGYPDAERLAAMRVAARFIPPAH
jgi:putative phosphoesterase